MRYWIKPYFLKDCEEKTRLSAEKLGLLLSKYGTYRVCHRPLRYLPELTAKQMKGLKITYNKHYGRPKIMKTNRKK